MTGHNAIEVTKTVLEVADVAWTAVESYHHHHHHHNHSNEVENHESTDSISDQRDRELEALRAENRRLRILLEANLKLFETLAESAALSHECPSDVSITNRFLLFFPISFLEFPAREIILLNKFAEITNFQLYASLVSMVTSKDFLSRLERLRQALSNGTQNQFPFKEPTGDF